MDKPLNEKELAFLESYANSTAALDDGAMDTMRMEVSPRHILSMIAEVRAARAHAVVRIDFSNLPPEKQRRVDELLEQIRTAPTHAMAVREADDALETVINSTPCVGENWRTCPMCNPPRVGNGALAPMPWAEEARKSSEAMTPNPLFSAPRDDEREG